MEISGSSSAPSRQAMPEAGRRRNSLFRWIACADMAAGLVYLGWRYTSSVNPDALALSIVLIAAESLSFLDSLLYMATMWKPLRRSSPPPLEGRSVDVFITTYNEDPSLVSMTAEAAMAIDWKPLSVYILDDGAREEMRDIATGLGCGYITRGEEWKGRNRHAKAGNVNNALSQTGGEFILILDADQIPEPGIVSRTMGYFADEKLAFVQTPQSFYNLPPGDPFGSDAPLFYGPVMRGKDGWNAAFFCGSNALLRREALMQVGLVAYAEAADQAFHSALRELGRLARPALGDDRKGKARKKAVRIALKDALARLKTGQSLQEVSKTLNTAIALSRPEGNPVPSRADFGITLDEEAIAVGGVSTVSVTEDMATALRLHAAGWRSAFHSEVLANGLAPEDLGAALTQRLRWAQGTIQVLLRDSPLTKKGLSLGQRLMYSATIFSYFSGFVSLIFVAFPLVFFFFDIVPIRAWNLDFFVRFLPFFALNRLMFLVAAEGLNTRRGEQYNLALFPLWIRAVVGVFLGREIGFSVTPKTRQKRNFLPMIKVQLAVIVLTLAGLVFCGYGILAGRHDWHDGAYLLAVFVNVFWGCYNAWQFLVIARAARYSPPPGWNPLPPGQAGKERRDRP